MTTKNYGLSVRDKLRNLVTENNNYQQLLIRYMHEQLLYRLSRSRYNDNFVLKGGALLFVHERFLARPTIDIDFLGERISRDQDTIKNAFIEILSQPCPEDGVVFDTDEDSIVVEDIILDREYNGVKLKFTGHLDTVVQKLSMDIGFGDIVVPSPEKLDYQPMIEGMPGFAINAYSLETVVAEKFQTMMARSLSERRGEEVGPGNVDTIRSRTYRKIRQQIERTERRILSTGAPKMAMREMCYDEMVPCESAPAPVSLGYRFTILPALRTILGY